MTEWPALPYDKKAKPLFFERSFLMSLVKFLPPLMFVLVLGIGFVHAQEEYIDDTIPPALLIDEADLDPVTSPSSESPPPLSPADEIRNLTDNIPDVTGTLPVEPQTPDRTQENFELSIDDLLGGEFLEDGVDGDQSLEQLGNQAQPGLALEKTRKELEEEARRKAYELAIQSLLPLRPYEIRGLLEKFDRTEESVQTPVYPAPKAKLVVENISLDPGTEPVVINLAHGHVTTLSILDVTGAKWPIEDISWAGNFEITETSKGEGSHIVRISPRTEYSSGNMSMRLLDLNTPVIISMQTNRDLVHYRFDAIIPLRGPFAETPLISNISAPTAQAGNDDLSGILQGIIPAGAERLNVSGSDARTSAYTLHDLTYVRTPLTLLSPSWSNSVASADGMRVYTVKNSPVLLLSDAGKVVRVRLSKREDLFDGP